MSASPHRWCVQRRDWNHFYGFHKLTVISRHKTEQAANKAIEGRGFDLSVRRLTRIERGLL